MKKNATIIFILFLFLACFSSCEKECRKEYHFEIPIEISPAKSTYQIGDTINVSFIYDLNDMMDLNSGETIEVSEFDIVHDFSFTRFDSVSLEDAIDYIDYSSLKGELGRQQLVGLSILNLNPVTVNSKREMEFYFIPKEVGNYSLEFSSFYDVSLEAYFLLKDRNCDEYLRVSWATNDKLDSNFQLYDEYRDDGTGLEGYTRQGGFSFKVE